MTTTLLLLLSTLVPAIPQTVTPAPPPAVARTPSSARRAMRQAPAQWIQQTSGTTASLRGVKAVSGKICWASGAHGTVLKTTDGGNHWQIIPVPGAEKLDFRDIEAPNRDANTAMVMSSGPAEQGQARLFKTSDGGRHWKEVFSATRKGVFFDSIAFWDHLHGIGLSDPVDGKFLLFVTADGGDSWRFLAPRQMPPALPGEGGFATSGTTIAVAGRHSVWFGTGGAQVSRVFRSSDNGLDWTAAETPVPAAKPSAGINSVLFVTETHGYIVGGDYLSPATVAPNSAVTFDGGNTWQPLAGSNYLTSISACRHGLLTIGASEKKISDAEFNAASVAPGYRAAFAVGSHGRIAKMLLPHGRCP